MDRYIDSDDDWDDDDWGDEASPDAQATDAAAGEDESEPEHSLTTVGRAATPTGSIEVRTTLNGLPTSIHIERSEMDGSAAKLAKTILLLCKQAGTRAGATQRAALLRDGHTLEAVSYTGLPGEREAAEMDRRVDEYFEGDETGTWLRRV
ncbi:hypothetical protein [Williamsia sp.]|uniref:hypothetical protein n=1 Tax=Williamsia sp. TaxID=1872085 RepID=UPI001A2896B1|nr:hypothetical protein [Williamsia sp.]MBJ7290829.1 hypothetical protein [Williamsia sp.]